MSGLTLQRRPGESILLSGGVRITYNGTDGRRAGSVTIEAPEGVTILREELAKDADRARMGHWRQGYAERRADRAQDEALCGRLSPGGGLSCTLPKGHDGGHVAHIGPDSATAARWPREGV